MKRYLLASAGALAMASLFGATAQAQYVGAQSDQEMSDRSSYDRQYNNRNNGSRDSEAWRDAYDSIYGGDHYRAGRDSDRRYDDQRAQYRDPYRSNRAEARDYRRDRYGSSRDQYARQGGGGYDDSGWRGNRGYPHTESFSDPGQLGPDRTMTWRGDQTSDRRQRMQPRDGSGWEGGEGYPHTESFSDRGNAGRNSGAYRDQYGQFVPLSPRYPETMSPRDNSRDYPRNYEMGNPYRDRGWQSGRAQGQYDYRPSQHPENQTWSDSGEMRHEAWEQGPHGYRDNGSGSYRGAGMAAPAGPNRMTGDRASDRRGVYARQSTSDRPVQGYIVGMAAESSGEPSQTMTEARRAAFGVDSDKDGFVSDDELGKLAEARFDRLDSDGNGELDESELKAAGLATGSGSSGGDADEATAKLDANSDGKVSREEFVKSASDAYGEADSDEDGKISIWEFRSHRMPG